MCVDSRLLTMGEGKQAPARQRQYLPVLSRNIGYYFIFEGSKS